MVYVYGEYKCILNFASHCDKSVNKSLNTCSMLILESFNIISLYY